MVSIVTASFLAPAHLPPIYIWVVVAFVATYVLIHFMLTVHQYIVHKSSSKYSCAFFIYINPSTNKILVLHN